MDDAKRFGLYDVYINGERAAVCESEFWAAEIFSALNLKTDFDHALRTRGMLYAVKKLEGSLIMEEMKKCLGNQTQAAKNLKMNRTTFVERWNQIRALSLK